MLEIHVHTFALNYLLISAHRGYLQLINHFFFNFKIIIKKPWYMTTFYETSWPKSYAMKVNGVLFHILLVGFGSGPAWKASILFMHYIYLSLCTFK